MPRANDRGCGTVRRMRSEGGRCASHGSVTCSVSRGADRLVAIAGTVAAMLAMAAGCPARLDLGENRDAAVATVDTGDGGCGDVRSDPSNCGACGRRCPRGICVDGECCIATRAAACRDAAGALVCADLDTDPEHCGECGRECDTGCAAGECCTTGVRPAVCPTSSGVACVDLASDEANCGGCGDVCDGSCAGGRCCADVVGGLCVPRSYAMRVLDAPEEVRWVHLYDVDGSGTLDMFAMCHVGRSVLNIPGRRDRVLEVRQRIDTGYVGPGFAMGDIDRDGALDFVTSVEASLGRGTDLRIFDGVAGGLFDAVTTLPEDTNPNWVALLDVDPDGRLDIAVRQADRGCIAFRRNLGGYSFGDGECVVPYATATEPEAILAVDDDRDGRPEIYEVRYQAEGRSIWRHSVGAGAVTASGRVDPPLDLFTHNIALRDLDRDGRVDLFVAELTDVWRTAVRTPADGGVEGVVFPTIDFSDELSIFQMSDMGDIDDDGVLDVVGFSTCGFCASRIYVLFGVP